MTDDYYLALTFPAALFFIMMVPFFAVLVFAVFRAALDGILG